MSARQAYGVVGEFESVEQVIAATRALRSEGFLYWEIYGPAPIEEIDRAVPTRRGTVITAIMVLAAVVGACVGYFFQYWGAVLDYPLNVGGRPYNGWPGFVPCAWEICALFTVYFGFFAFFISCGLSRLYHPIFAAPDFERASQDRFFIGIEAADPGYDAARLRSLLARQGAIQVAEIEP
jgi:Alternative complex III, ActD subunit